MELTSGYIAALVLAVLALIAVVSVFIFLCLKLYQSNARINDLEERVAKIQDYQYKTEDEVVLRRKAKDNHSHSLRDISFLTESSGIQDGNSEASHSSYGARATILCEREIINVHGNLLADPQIIKHAQTFHKDLTKADNVVGIDAMDIRFDKSGTDFISSETKRKTINEGRPTSLLLDLNSSQDKPNEKYEEGVFIHKTLSKTGGILSVLGIKLTVPTGALDGATKITLGVTWDSSICPNLQKKSSILGPIVVCQPSIKFLKPVSLSFPHCAVDHAENWKLSVLHRENDMHDETTEWKELKSDNSTNITISKHRVTLSVMHFTLYTLVGESVEGRAAVKAVKLLAFTSPFQMNRMFTVRIYCINNYEPDSSEMKQIKATEAELKEKMADVLQPMFIKDNGEDVVVNMSKVSNGWTLDGQKQETIDFESIWHCLSPSCKFIFHPLNAKLRKIVCEFSYSQKPNSKVRYLKIAEEQIQFSSIALRDSLEPELKLMQKMIIMLDPKSENDYRILAEKIGYNYNEIKWLETQKSPTETLLEKWVEDGKHLVELKDYLKEMGRLDIVSELSVEKDGRKGTSA